MHRLHSTKRTISSRELCNLYSVSNYKFTSNFQIATKDHTILKLIHEIECRWKECEESKNMIENQHKDFDRLMSKYQELKQDAGLIE